MTDRFAQVAVLNGSPQRGAFTYALPSGMELRRGMSVVVPWRTRWAIGVVLQVVSRSDVDEPRAIERTLDELPLLSQRQIELAEWIAATYLAPLSASVALFLPPGTPARPRQAASGFAPVVPRLPTSPKRLVLDISVESLRDVIAGWPSSKNSRPANLIELLAHGDLAEAEAASVIGGRRALDRWLTRTAIARRQDGIIQLSVPSDDARLVAASLRRTASERRQLALLQLLESGDLPEPDARRQSGATRADVGQLLEQGFIRRFVGRERAPAAIPAPAPPLTEEQRVAAERIVRSMEATGGETLLLHGVTGSGKTEVYLAAAQRALDSGGGVIVLVPEIALAPQTIARFESRFPGQVAVRHSGLSRSEAREQWRQVYAGEKRILIGARSALFGPVRDLALVIIDEEHEWTYKQQDPQPRYHATAVATEMSRFWSVTSVLGSATPDLATMAVARSGSDRLLTLRDRVQSGASAPVMIPQPVVDVVDMREELAAGVRSVFSRPLDQAISQALEREEQVLLFLNRRGMSALVCRACGTAVECGRCSIAMTLHRPGPYLQCHECGERQAIPRLCPTCADERLGAMSFGTAQLETEVKRRWGDVPVTRWDRDTTLVGGSHEALLRDFASGRSRVLIGTQMIAKGLDLPRVTVAGLVNADLSLRESDFRAPERTFQLISQVAGRAGRGALGGRVIVQTYAPDHYAIAAAASHDYDAFYGPEMRLRSALDYPPFGRLARLTVSRSTPSEADAEADRVLRELQRLRDRTPGCGGRCDRSGACVSGQAAGPVASATVAQGRRSGGAVVAA